MKLLCLISFVSGRGSASYSTSLTTPNIKNERRTFVITHPLHPLYGQEFKLDDYHSGNKISKVFFYDENGHRKLVPGDWTDIVTEDPYIKIAEGRSLFRYEDLVQLASLIQNIDDELRKNEKVSS
jgi:hypothetical protein